AGLKNANNTKVFLGLIIAVFSFVLYAPSIQHDFTLDDNTVTTMNNLTTRGFSGIPNILATDYWYGFEHELSRGPIYRPTSVIVFAAVWEFYPGNPHAYHFVNVLFYTLTCIFLFLVLCKLFKQNLIFPFVCTLLYVGHPIHTEVVNSIKSLDEILCFLFGIVSIWFMLKWVSNRSWLSLTLGGISFFLSLISKETGVAFLLIIPLTIYFFTDIPIKKLTTSFFLLLAFTGVWLIIRMAVFKDLPDNSANTATVLNNTLNAAPDQASKYATAFYILLKYIGLLIFPHPLSYDYSYAQITVRQPGDLAAIAGMLLYLAMGIYAIIKIRKKTVIAYGILFFLIALAPVSNLFILIASTMAERFMYIPSLGFCIVLTYFLIRITKSETGKPGIKDIFHFFSRYSLLLFVVLIISAAYYYKTASRNKDWKDNLTLFTHDVKSSPNSARTNQILGSTLMLAAMASPDKQHQVDTLNLAKTYSKKSLEIYSDKNFAPLLDLGVIYIYQDKFDSACEYLKSGLKIMPNHIDLNYNYGLALFHLKKYDEAIKVMQHTIELSPDHKEASYNLAALYQNTGNYDQALLYYSKVIALNPNNALAYYNSGVISRAKGDSVKAKEFIQRAASLGYSPK
ncbi:MAG TPA: tetratricopeptide repeat protein, partial [Chitinophagaceae bacterium]